MDEVLLKKRPNAASMEKALELGDKAPSVRLQLTLKPEFAKRLDKMKKSARADTYSDVVRDALRLYEGVLKQIGDDRLGRGEMPHDVVRNALRLYEGVFRHIGEDGRLVVQKADGTLVEFVII
jgi:Arc/MetJ-type ribon-helix-helix transcriptional regulator